jgi:hypothetical protein
MPRRLLPVEEMKISRLRWTKTILSRIPIVATHTVWNNLLSTTALLTPARFSPVEVRYTMHCPHCYAKDQFNLSRFRGLDLVMLLLLHRPFRCRVCRTRFFGFFPFRNMPTPSKKGPSNSWTDIGMPAGKEEEGEATG